MAWLDGIANFASTLATNAQNRDLTQQQWARDDSSHQRAVADMRAAGINPILAAGAGAQSSAPIPMQSPNTGGGLGGDGSQIVKMITAKNNIHQSNMQTAIIKEQEKQARDMSAVTHQQALAARDSHYSKAIYEQQKMNFDRNISEQEYLRLKRLNQFAEDDGIADPHGKAAQSLDMIRILAEKAAKLGNIGDTITWASLLEMLGKY